MNFAMFEVGNTDKLIVQYSSGRAFEATNAEIESGDEVVTDMKSSRTKEPCYLL